MTFKFRAYQNFALDSLEMPAVCGRNASSGNERTCSAQQASRYCVCYVQYEKDEEVSSVSRSSQFPKHLVRLAGRIHQ